MRRPEPAAAAAAVKELVSATVKAAVIFGVVAITTEQFGVLMLLVDAMLAAVMVLFIRPRVTPVESPRLPEGTNVVTTLDGQPTGITTI